MTNDNQAANRFLSQLQAQAASADGESPELPQQIVINRPVRCTFYVGTPPAPPAKKRARAGKTEGNAA